NPPGSSWSDSGATLPVSATANSCYHFVNWTGDTTTTVNPLGLVMNNKKNITANFAINTDTITASAGTNGSITPSGAVSVNCGSNQTFTITPNSCARTDSVIVDGVNQGSISSYTFTNVTANHTIRST